MLEWLVLPALILVVILAIVNARPKPKPKPRPNQAGQEGRRTGRMISGYRSESS